MIPSAILLILLLVPTAGPPIPTANPKAVQEVKSAKRTTADATWWGFDPANSTTAIQSAIHSGAKRVVIPNVGRDWVVDPIFLVSSQEMVIQRGVRIVARKGGFTGLNDCLFKADRQHDVTIRGNGAVLAMQKPEYTKGEWRHCLELDSCTNVKLLGLTLRDSGGDGIYIGNSDPKQPFCRDVVIRDCVMDNNRRQGMSVITAVNLRVERCAFRSTSGTAPRAGVDLEPNEPVEKLVNCVFTSCSMENNEGPGILIYLGQLSESTEPLSIRFDRCRVTSDGGSGIEVGGTRRAAPTGEIAFLRCSIASCGGVGLNVFNKSKDAVRLRFERCAWRNVSQRDSRIPPLQIAASEGADHRVVGGADFVDCSVDDDRDRPFLAASGSAAPGGIGGIHGTITTRNPHGARASLGASPVDVTLVVRRAR